MRVGASRRGWWVSMPLWVLVVFGPFIAYVWLMWLLVKWGGIGLFWLTVLTCRGLAGFTRRAMAAYRRHRALTAAHP